MHITPPTISLPVPHRSHHPTNLHSRPAHHPSSSSFSKYQRRPPKTKSGTQFTSRIPASWEDTKTAMVAIRTLVSVGIGRNLSDVLVLSCRASYRIQWLVAYMALQDTSTQLVPYATLAALKNEAEANITS